MTAGTGTLTSKGVGEIEFGFKESNKGIDNSPLYTDIYTLSRNVHIRKYALRII
jgi:hypothetical protein